LASRVDISFRDHPSRENARVEAALRQIYTGVPGICRFSFVREGGKYSILEASWLQPGSQKRTDLRPQVARVLEHVGVPPAAVNRAHAIPSAVRHVVPAGRARGVRVLVTWEPAPPRGWQTCEVSIAKLLSLVATPDADTQREFDLEIDWLGRRRGWRCTRVRTDDPECPPRFHNAVNNFLPALKGLGPP
jgi:hypothetical protein